MHTISLKIPPALSMRLTQVAKDEQRSKSAIVREAIDIYLRGGVDGRRVSALDGIEDLIGCIEGPGDLSTNKEYLNDLGK